jgi:hypothetical protein
MNIAVGACHTVSRHQLECGEGDRVRANLANSTPGTFLVSFMIMVGFVLQVQS